MPPPLPAAAAAEGHTNLKEHVGEVLLGLDGCGFLLIQQRLQGELGRWKSARKGTVLDTKAAETQGKGSVLPAISSAYSAGVSLRSHSPVQGQSCQFARADHGAGGSNNARPMHGYAEVLMLFPAQHVAVPVKEEQEKKEQQEQEQEQQEQEQDSRSSRCSMWQCGPQLHSPSGSPPSPSTSSLAIASAMQVAPNWWPRQR